MDASFISNPVFYFFYPELQLMAAALLNFRACVASYGICNYSLLRPLAWLLAIVGQQVTPGIMELFMLKITDKDSSTQSFPVWQHWYIWCVGLYLPPVSIGLPSHAELSCLQWLISFDKYTYSTLLLPVKLPLSLPSKCSYFVGPPPSHLLSFPLFLCKERVLESGISLLFFSPCPRLWYLA